MPAPSDCEQRPGPWRIAFFGSADFAMPALNALLDGPDEVALIISAPPAPSGRGRKLAETPVAALARERRIPLIESASLKKGEVLDKIEAARPDLLVVAAYRGFLPPRLLRLGAHPPLNIHPSLLPRHRGAAPVNWSLIHGDEHVGVSIIFLVEEMDAGPILAQAEYRLEGPEKAGELEAHLAELGAAELMKVIAGLKDRCIVAKAQCEAEATVNPLLCKRDGAVDWRRPAAELAARINGVDPWPGAQTRLRGRLVKIFGARPAETKEGARPGQILGLDAEGRLLVAAGSGAVALDELQPEGKKRMPAADFQRGYQPDVFDSCEIL